MNFLKIIENFENWPVWMKIFLLILYGIFLLYIAFKSSSIENWPVRKKIFLLTLYGIFFSLLSYISGKYYMRQFRDVASDPFHIGGWIFLIILGIILLYLWIFTRDREFVRYAFPSVSLILFGLIQLLIIWRFLLK